MRKASPPAIRRLPFTSRDRRVMVLYWPCTAGGTSTVDWKVDRVLAVDCCLRLVYGGHWDNSSSWGTLGNSGLGCKLRSSAACNQGGQADGFVEGKHQVTLILINSTQQLLKYEKNSFRNCYLKFSIFSQLPLSPAPTNRFN